MQLQRGGQCPPAAPLIHNSCAPALLQCHAFLAHPKTPPFIHCTLLVAHCTLLVARYHPFRCSLIAAFACPQRMLAALNPAPPHTARANSPLFPPSL